MREEEEGKGTAKKKEDARRETQLSFFNNYCGAVDTMRHVLQTTTSPHFPLIKAS
jgi:hypothetical protein